MNRFERIAGGAFVFAAVMIAGANCQVVDDESDDERIEDRSSALTGAGGTCPPIAPGGQGGFFFTSIPPGDSPRGYTDSSSVHTVV